MKLADCFYLGHLTKTYGLKGELILFLDVDDITPYLDLDVILLEEKGALLPYFIEQADVHGHSRLKVSLEDVDSIETATAILKKDIYLPLAKLPSLGETQFYYHEVAGFAVIDVDNDRLLGEVTGVIDLPANPLLQVQSLENEILIPINDETVVKIVRGEKRLVLRIPDGLLSLYTEDPTEDRDQ